MTEPAGPPRTPTVRPVTRDLHDRRTEGGSITHGSFQPQVPRRNLLQPWQRDALMALLDQPLAFRSQPQLLAQLAVAGLVTLVADGDQQVATITDVGTEAFVHGWYPA